MGTANMDNPTLMKATLQNSTLHEVSHHTPAQRLTLYSVEVNHNPITFNQLSFVLSRGVINRIMKDVVVRRRDGCKESELVFL